MRKNLRLKIPHFALLAAVLMVQGCATPVGEFYHPYGLHGLQGVVGYKESQLAPDVFRVSFDGNIYSENDEVADLALLRGAELCLQHGFPYMALLDSKDQGRTNTYVSPRSAHTTGTINTYGNSGTYSGTTTYSGGQVYSFYEPSTGLTVQGLKEKPLGAFAFETQFLIETLKTKYKIGK